MTHLLFVSLIAKLCKKNKYHCNSNMSRKDALISQGNATAEPLTKKHKIRGYQQIIEEIIPGRNPPRKKVCLVTA
jgi:hypothetical protein